MNYRSFGKTDLKVSEIGLGCASLGGGLYYKDDQESIKTLLQAFDSGINFYDTADSYGLGKSQMLIGQAFKGRRDRVIIASKIGIFYSTLGILTLRMRPLLRPVSRFFRPMKDSLHRMRASQKHYDFSPVYLTKAVDRSLKRLQSDYLDLFQLYNPPTSILEKGEFCETLESLKAKGKIRYYGVACVTVNDALICLRHPGISSVQVDISLLDQEAITKLLPLAQEKKLAVIARHPRATGLLTNNQSDIMGDASLHDQREFKDRRKKAKTFRFLIKEGRTMAQAAIQFVLQLQGVSAVLPRAVNRNQLDENLGALTAPPLTTEELTRIYSMSS
ncbi:MAG: aldo/keto reductase [Deltaproteobacteria bacterium]|nr:aldo/keto reductase [Deltaproteobacteria bacterium]